MLQPAGEKPKRAKKDKDAPKKGLSAFMFFSNDKREEVRARPALTGWVFACCADLCPRNSPRCWTLTGLLALVLWVWLSWRGAPAHQPVL